MARTVGEAPRGLVLALVALLIPAPAAHLFAGDLLTSQTPPVGDATYGYVQTTVLF
jgi:hypothetical protein